MFVPMPLPPPAPVPAHFYNKYETLDPEMESSQFVATEGTYKAHEILRLAYPAPHPSEPPPNPNPLTPRAAPLHSGMHLSLLSLSETAAPSRTFRSRSQGEMPAPERLVSDEKPFGGDEDSASSNGGDSQSTGGPAFSPVDSAIHRGSNGSANADLALSVSGSMSMSMSASMTTSVTAGSSVFDNLYDGPAKRKRRTGTSANGTTSTFVSRAIADPNMPARLNDHRPDDGYFLFANIGRSLAWVDNGCPSTVRHEPLSKLMFSLATVTCHDVNLVTKGIRSIDLVVGTNTGDILWYDPVACRYLRYNKQRCINPSAVTQIQWLPGSDHLFVAAHADGALVTYDTARDDAEFVATQAPVWSSAAADTDHFSSSHTTTTTTSGSLNNNNNHHHDAAISILRSASDARTMKSNPVSYFHLSRQSINAFAFSPDATHLACVSDDGCLKVMDYRHERLLDVFSSYFGGFTCVTWSPDGHYIVTGGKDDLVTIWSFTDRRIVARCHGHNSFVTGIVFDAFQCDDEGNYRFGSISEDGNLCLWDFNLSSLHRPSSRKSQHGVVHTPRNAHRPIISGLDGTSPPTHPPPTTTTTTTTAHRPSDDAATTQQSSDIDTHRDDGGKTVRDGVRYHAPESRLSTAILSPITVTRVDDQTPTHLIFQRDAILIATIGKKYGHVKRWRRPL